MASAVLIAERSVRYVFAQRGGFIGLEENLRHRLDVRCVERVELCDMRQNMAEILRHAQHFFVGQAKVRQIGDVTDVFFR